MEDVIKLAVLCVASVVFAALLKKTSPAMALLLMAAVCVLGLAWLAAAAEHLSGLWAQIDAVTGLDEQLFLPLVKTLCIAVVCRLCAEVCNDAEYAAAATLVELAGAFAAICVSIPLWEAVWNMLQELL